MNKNIDIEIWSDIMCPFCYIGKRHLEQAIDDLNIQEKVNIRWKSFQLDPTIPTTFTQPVNAVDYLANRKGITKEQSLQMHHNVTEMALTAGLNYQFDKVIVANSFSAHRIIQKAKEMQLDDAIEEKFFEAYFINGKNLSERETLLQIGQSAGLSEEAINEAIDTDDYAYAVNQDIAEANQLGIHSVPFFVFERKYAVSGAQPVEQFKVVLNKIMNSN